MLGIPGATVKQYFNSFFFAKSLKLSVPTFGIFSPYPGTELTKYAIKRGYLDKDFSLRGAKYGLKSVLKNYSEEEKDFQIHLAYLGSIFAVLPDFFVPLLKILLKLKLTKIYSLVGAAYVSCRTYIK